MVEVTDITVIELSVVDSTQDEVRSRLVGAAPHEVVAVSARSQRAGRGREGRTWQDPPGSALLLSIGVRGPADPGMLDQLPGDLARIVVACIGVPATWREPNDIVDDTGAKIGGVLVDARTTGMLVDEVIAGIGLNVTGPAFETADRRAATSIEQCTGAAVDEAALRSSLVEAVGKRLSERR